MENKLKVSWISLGSLIVGIIALFFAWQANALQIKSKSEDISIVDGQTYLGIKRLDNDIYESIYCVAEFQIANEGEFPITFTEFTTNINNGENEVNFTAKRYFNIYTQSNNFGFEEYIESALLLTEPIFEPEIANIPTLDTEGNRITQTTNQNVAPGPFILLNSPLGPKFDQTSNIISQSFQVSDHSIISLFTVTRFVYKLKEHNISINHENGSTPFVITYKLKTLAGNNLLITSPGCFILE